MPTLREVAQHAGVSYTQASYVLNGRNLNCVSPDRRERIQIAMRELGYRPNSAARATRRGQFGAISLLLGNYKERSTLPSRLLMGIHDALAERDLNLMVVRLPDERLTDATYVPRILRETTSDGLLIDYTHGIPRRMMDLIEQARVPAVWLNSKQSHDCVRPDDYDAGVRATKLMLEHGHTRVAYADFTHGPNFPSPHYSAVDRRQGYLDTMSEAGLKPQLMVPDAGGTRHAFAMTQLAQADRPSAIVCFGDTTFMPLYHAALRRGIEVGRDLSLMMFASPGAPLFAPSTAVMLVPEYDEGVAGIQMLLNKIDLPHRDQPSRLLPFELVEGRTVGPFAESKNP